MSVVEFENPVVTVLRLIESRLRVVKDDGGLARVLCSQANYDRELLKDYDAQITLQVDPLLGVQDQLLNLSGSKRRQTYYLKCIVHTVDKVTPGADPGRVMRSKVTEAIKAIIRENRTSPYQTTYNFVGLGYPTGDPHKALSAGASSELVPSSGGWAELSPADYQGIWYNDGIHCKSTSITNQLAMMLFRFKISARRQCVKSLVLRFVGYGTAPGGNGVVVKIWNHTEGAWQYPQYGNADTDETLTIGVSANCMDYIDSEGCVWMLARTANPSNGVAPAAIYCDYAQLTVQVRGITNCDVVSYKPIDIVDVKPFLFKTEFVLKASVFEFIP